MRYRPAALPGPPPTGLQRVSSSRNSSTSARRRSRPPGGDDQRAPGVRAIESCMSATVSIGLDEVGHLVKAAVEDLVGGGDAGLFQIKRGRLPSCRRSPARIAPSVLQRERQCFGTPSGARSRDLRQHQSSGRRRSCSVKVSRSSPAGRNGTVISSRRSTSVDPLRRFDEADRRKGRDAACELVNFQSSLSRLADGRHRSRRPAMARPDAWSFQHWSRFPLVLGEKAEPPRRVARACFAIESCHYEFTPAVGRSALDQAGPIVMAGLVPAIGRGTCRYGWPGRARP